MASATVVVAGALANKPDQAGEAWVKLSWVRGLQRLGFDVWFVEQLAESMRYDERAPRWFRSVTERFGLSGRSVLLSAGQSLAGASADELLEVAPEASLVNISGHLTEEPLFGRFRRRVMVDIDPGFTQFWHLEGLAGANVAGHDAYFTIGERIGKDDCPIPTGGIEWRPVRQPVVLEDWPLVDPGAGNRFTTIATWRGPFGPVEHGGRTYGLKVHEFRRFIELPRRLPYRFEVALDIDPGDDRDLEALRRNGWEVADPREVAADPDALRAYIQGSGAEFSPAQGMYVDTACGWFSDRSVRYLASGKPVLVQDTGFSHILPVGEGLLAFRTLEEAVAGAGEIASNYDEHCAAARAIAEEYFDAERVLTGFCEQAKIG
ncbi:MAG: hypothetical protein AABM43_02545 [Actinomycetota bacterium]